MTDIVSRFFAAWAVQDDATRDAEIAATLGADIFYADPRTPAPLTTPEAVAHYVGQFSKSAPGWPVEAVHLSTTLSFVRATVRFGAGDQAQWGQYTADLGDSGRITRLIGFVGTGAPA